MVDRAPGRQIGRKVETAARHLASIQHNFDDIEELANFPESGGARNPTLFKLFLPGSDNWKYGIRFHPKDTKNPPDEKLLLDIAKRLPRGFPRNLPLVFYYGPNAETVVFYAGVKVK